MSEPINWEQLGRELGTLRADGEHVGRDDARRAIERLIGEDRLRAAVDYYVVGGPGSELARHVLWQLRPWSAMQRCYDIYRTAADAETKASSVELLRVVADRRALPWTAEFLADPNPGVQLWGAGLLDQLLWSHLIESAECADLLRTVQEHPNDQVRERGECIRKYLKERKLIAERPAAGSETKG